MRVSSSTPRPRIWEWAATRLSPRRSRLSETVVIAYCMSISLSNRKKYPNVPHRSHFVSMEGMKAAIVMCEWRDTPNLMLVFLAELNISR